MEDGGLPQGRTQDKKKQALGHHSPPEEGMEGLLRLQGQQLQRSTTGLAHDSGGKRRWKRGSIRRPDSCHLDSPVSRLPDILCCWRESQLCQVLQGPSWNWRMDQHRGWSGACGFQNVLLHFHRGKENDLHQKLKTHRVQECQTLRLKQLVFSSKRIHEKPPDPEQKLW